jgi:hypothetical protein
VKPVWRGLTAISLTVLAICTATATILWILRHCALEGVLVFGVCCVAAFWGWIIRWLFKDGRITFSHILVIWMVASGTVMGGASYYLAYREITATLETLSRYVMVETVAGSAGYFLKSVVENSVDKIKGNTKKCTRDL